MPATIAGQNVLPACCHGVDCGAEAKPWMNLKGLRWPRICLCGVLRPFGDPRLGDLGWV